MEINRCARLGVSLLLFLFLGFSTTAALADAPANSFKVFPTYFPTMPTSAEFVCNKHAVAGTKSGNEFNFSLSGIYDAQVAGQSATCDLDYNKQKYATVQFHNLGRFYCAQPYNFCWALQSINVTLADNSINSDSETSSNIIPAKSSTEAFASDWHLNTYQIQPGRISISGSVATPPAKLACDGGKNFAEKTDGGDKYFDLTDMANRSAPTTSNVLTHCKLEDSATTPNVYATLDSIQTIVGTPKDGGDIFWAAKIPSFHNGIISYLVSKPTGSDPAKVPAGEPEDLFNQWAMTIKHLAPGDITFGGGFSKITVPVYVSCDGGTAMELSSDHKLDLLTLHNSKSPVTAPDTQESFNDCTLETDPTKTPVTTYAHFKVSAIQGDYTNDGTNLIWAANISNIAQGTSPLYVDPAATTATCDKDDPQYCNQTTINFATEIPGSVVVQGGSAFPTLPTQDVELQCGSTWYRPQAGPDSDSVQFSLETLHGTAVDKDAPVNLDNCDLYIGRSERIGTVSIEAIQPYTKSGTAPQPSMWAAKSPSASNGLKLADPQSTARYCDNIDQHCNRWDLDLD